MPLITQSKTSRGGMVAIWGHPTTFAMFVGIE
jgi:hypothetical protein